MAFTSAYSTLESSTKTHTLCGCCSDCSSCCDWLLCYPCMVSRTCNALDGEGDTCTVCMCLLATPTWIPIFYNVMSCCLRQSVSTKYLITDMGCCTLSDESIEVKRGKLVEADLAKQKAKADAEKAAEDAKNSVESGEPIATPECPDTDDAADKAEEAADAAKEQAKAFLKGDMVAEAISNLCLAIIAAPCSNCQVWRELSQRNMGPGGSCCAKATYKME